jgi:hypothetical protein
LDEGIPETVAGFLLLAIRELLGKRARSLAVNVAAGARPGEETTWGWNMRTSGTGSVGKAVKAIKGVDWRTAVPLIGFALLALGQLALVVLTLVG